MNDEKMADDEAKMQAELAALKKRSAQKKVAPEPSSQAPQSPPGAPGSGAAPPQKAPPALKEYQQQPNAAAELQRAIESVPLKDYSEYEISLETKDHYEDALFSSDEDLDQALNEAATVAKQPAPEQTQAEKSPPDEQQVKVVREIDFSVFLGAGEQTDDAIEEAAEGAETDLPVVDAGLNGSPFMPPDGEDRAYSNAPRPALDKVDSGEREQSNSADTGKANIVAALAKKQYSQAKGQVDEYFGRSLPNRDLPLDFQFSAQKSKKEFDNIVSGYDIKKLFTTKGKGLHTILKTADEDLAKVVKCKMSRSNRQGLLDTYTEPLAKCIIALITLFERKPSAPDDDKRSEMIDNAQSALKNLINGYKQLYSSIYELSNYLYGPQRNNANALAKKLIDLLCLEQRLVVALQCPLPSSSAKTMNKLFVVLSQYEPQTINQSIDSLALQSKITISELFARYQLLLSLDLHYISSSLNQPLNHYIHQHRALLNVVPLDQVPCVDEPAWVISHDCVEAPVRVAAEDIEGQWQQCETAAHPLIFIQPRRFIRQIRLDFAQCLTSIGIRNHKLKNAALDGLKLQDALALLSALNYSLNMIENKNNTPTFSVYRPGNYRIYTGMESCSSYLAYYYAKSLKDASVQAKSSKELPPKPKVVGGAWTCAMEDEQRLYLQTIETKAGVMLDIGLPILITQLVQEDTDSDDDEALAPAKAPSASANAGGEETRIIGRIIRLERGQQGRISIIVEKIGNDAVSTCLLKSSTKDSAGIIAVEGNSRYYLSSHSEHYAAGTSFAVKLPNDLETVLTIAQLRAVSAKLQVLTVN